MDETGGGSPSQATPNAELADDDPVWARLEDQLRFYGRRSRECRRWYMLLKGAQMLVAASITVVAAVNVPGFVVAAQGAGVLLLEGVQQLGQYHQNWTSYRTTAEALKHEKFLFLAGAGDYANEPNARMLLAERTETLVSTEHARWLDFRRDSDRRLSQLAGGNRGD
jgi:hypothetical protein